MPRILLVLVGLCALLNLIYAQESKQFLSWDDRAVITSMDSILVKNSGLDQGGFACFAWRTANYTEQTASGQLVDHPYQSWHLEIRTVSTIRSTRVVDATLAQTMKEAYELAFYQRSSSSINDLSDKVLWGKVIIPAERVSQVNNGDKEAFAFYSIDLVSVPYTLWRTDSRGVLDIRRIEYVVE